MLVWKLKWSLSGHQLYFQDNVDLVVWSVFWKPQGTTCSRTRAGDRGHPPACVRSAFCIVGNGEVAMLSLLGARKARNE